MIGIGQFFRMGLSFFLFCGSLAFAGIPQEVKGDSTSAITDSSKHFSKKWENQSRIALSYFPELKGIHIGFVEKVRSAPLATTPTFRSLFRRHEKRTYKVIISRKTLKMLDSILLKNLSFDAQVGVIGHELSHITDMKRFGFFGFIKHAFHYTFSRSYGDRFEFGTDRICIQHGMGLYLLAWSREVRKKLHKKQFFQEKSTDDMPERYMNPETILKEMEKMKTL
jgi:hypothetical protein